MKITMINFRYIVACLLICTFVACSDDDENKGSDATIEVLDPENMSISFLGADNEAKSISFVADNDWIAYGNLSWINLEKKTGPSGEQKITVAVEDNDDVKGRTGTITFKDKVSQKTVDITVVQGGKEEVFVFSPVEESILKIDNEKQEITAEVSVLCNYDYVINVTPEWLTYEKVGKNSDGSIKYILHADPEKLYAAGGYAAQTATVSFVYQTETRSPAKQDRTVKFAGITPAMTSDMTPVILDDLLGNGYEATIHITSNVRWALGNTPSFTEVTYPTTNKSADFFEINTSVKLVYNKDELQIEEENGKLTFVDVKGKPMDYNLDVKYPGVGNDYVSIDHSAFAMPDNQLYMFEALGPELYPGYNDDIAVNFQVKAADAEQVNFYLVRQNFAGSPIYSTFMNSFYDEVSTDMTGYQGWGFVEDATVRNTRTAVETLTKTLFIKSRGNEWNGSSSEDKDRYFALFAVSATKYPTFEDLFNEDGELKPELDSKFISLGQKKKGGVEDFKCEELTGKTLTAKAAGETFSFEYSGLDLTTEDWGASWYSGVVVEEGVMTKGDSYFGGGIIDLNGTNFGTYENGVGTITIKVSPNTTGKPRSEKFAICAGTVGDGNAVITYFTIEQAAN